MVGKGVLPGSPLPDSGDGSAAAARGGDGEEEEDSDEDIRSGFGPASSTSASSSASSSGRDGSSGQSASPDLGLLSDTQLQRSQLAAALRVHGMRVVSRATVDDYVLAVKSLDTLLVDLTNEVLVNVASALLRSPEQLHDPSPLSVRYPHSTSASASSSSSSSAAAGSHDESVLSISHASDAGVSTVLTAAEGNPSAASTAATSTPATATVLLRIPVGARPAQPHVPAVTLTASATVRAALAGPESVAREVASLLQVPALSARKARALGKRVFAYGLEPRNMSERLKLATPADPDDVGADPVEAVVTEAMIHEELARPSVTSTLWPDLAVVDEVSCARMVSRFVDELLDDQLAKVASALHEVDRAQHRRMMASMQLPPTNKLEPIHGRRAGGRKASI